MPTLNLAITTGADDGRFQNSVAAGQNPFFGNTDTTLTLGSVASGFDFVSGFLRFSGDPEGRSQAGVWRVDCAGT